MKKSLGTVLLAALTLAVVPTVFADDTARVKKDVAQEQCLNTEAKAKQTGHQAQEEKTRKEAEAKLYRDAEKQPAKKAEPH